MFIVILYITTPWNLIELDEECKRILVLASRSPKTPPQISKLAAIPITRCWQKVRMLEAMGMIHQVLTYVGKNGRSVSYYETTLLPDLTDELGAENTIKLPYLT